MVNREKRKRKRRERIVLKYSKNKLTCSRLKGRFVRNGFKWLNS
jgi:hypothetical protein